MTAETWRGGKNPIALQICAYPGGGSHTHACTQSTLAEKPLSTRFSAKESLLLLLRLPAYSHAAFPLPIRNLGTNSHFPMCFNLSLNKASSDTALLASLVTVGAMSPEMETFGHWERGKEGGRVCVCV